jgi:hypothetical protein
MVQEVGWAMLRDMGVSLVAVDSPQAFLDDSPTAKLSGARDRKRARMLPGS